MNSFTLIKTALYKYKVSLALILVILLAVACTRRESFPEDSEMPVEAGERGEAVVKYDGVLLAQVVFDSVDYIVKKEDLLQPFIREFGDGTVVDKVMIRKVQESPKDTAAYYLVGLGINKGVFRSMALRLDVTSDNSLYLSSQGDKYMCNATPGCDFCYFTFLGNRITGCECSARAAGNNCSYKTSQVNTMLSNSRIRQLEGRSSQ